VTTRFFLYFADRHGAVCAVAALTARGFVAEMSLGWDDPFWNVVARRELESDAVEDADREMREFVLSLGGDYGGFDQRPA
jgi:hypothetical protein